MMVAAPHVDAAPLRLTTCAASRSSPRSSRAALARSVREVERVRRGRGRPGRSTPEEIVELADAVAASGGIASGIGTTELRRPARRRGRRPATRRSSSAWRSSPRAAAGPGCRRGRHAELETRSRARTTDADDDRRDPARLAGGLPVRGAPGARRLDAARGARRSTPSCSSPSRTRSPTSTPSSTSATPTTCPPSGSRSSTRGRRAGCERAGSRWKLYICTYEVPGGLPLPPGADRPRAHAPSTGRAATSSSTTRRGRTSGSASTPRPPPARSPPAATRPPVSRRRHLRIGHRRAGRLRRPRAVADAVVQPRAAPARTPAGPGRRSARRRRLVGGARRRSPRPSRTAAAARRRRPRRCG